MGPQLYRCGNGQMNSGAARAQVRLQWGRNFIVAEIHSQGFGTGVLTVLQWGRNFIVAEITFPPRRPIPGTSRFNGAATLSLRKFDALYMCKWFHGGLQWGRNFIVAEMRHIAPILQALLLASMGPQLYRCGNLPTMVALAAVVSVLQWGRNFIVAEICSMPFNHA